MTDRGCRTVFLLICLALTETLSSEPFTYTINTKKWSHVLDDHFISITINPTDLLQGKAFGLGMNSTVAILQGLSPAYIRIGSADTGKYTFKRSRYSGDVTRTEDEFIITESHWTTLNDIVRSAGLDVIVCLNAAHRNGASKKWDTRNSLELISFSDSKGYNLTFQLGYEVQRHSGVSGHQFGKDLKRLRTILNAFPRYQNSKLIGPDIRYLGKKEDVEFVNELLSEAGSVIDAVTWHPRWPQPSKMKVSDVSELGYEFPSDYLEWDRSQIGKILQRSVLKNSMWIGEPKTESTGTFAEGLLWARRLVLAAKLGIEVVMKQPSLMDISHPKPEYWIAYLHKRLLGRAVLETRSSTNQSEIAVITHCSNPLFWAERSNKAMDGSVTIYAVNMNGKDQKLHLKGTGNGKSQIVLQYLLTSGSDPDSVFSQMTYLNGEPLLMTEDGNLPDITPRLRRIERGLYFKLPPYSVGFLVVPEARVKICQVQPAPASVPHAENTPAAIGEKNVQKNMPNARSLNQLIVDKLKNPVSESDEELYDDGMLSDDSSDRELSQESAERPVTSRRVRQITVEDIGQELKEKIREIRDMLQSTSNEKGQGIISPESLSAAEEKISSLTHELGAATRMSNQEEEFGRFLHHSGLNQNFGSLMVNERTARVPNLKRSLGKNAWTHKTPAFGTFKPLETKIRRFRRSISYPEDDYEEESTESYSSEEEDNYESRLPHRKFSPRKRVSRFHENSDERGNNPNYSGPPNLRGLENKYRSFITYKIQDGKKRLNDLRRLKKKNDLEEPKKANDRKTNFSGSDLQEEILMKEVEVLQKTEEAMANLIKNHKKRQETIEEIILHEISDIKEDRLTALEDMRQHKEIIQEQANGYNETPEEIATSVKDVLDVLHGPITKRSISEVESNLNGLENSADEKKPKIVKRSVDSSYERSSKRRKSRKINRGYDDSRERDRHFRRSRSEKLDKIKNFIQSRERIRDRNIFRKKHNKNMRKFRLDGSDENSDEVLKNYDTDFLDKPEEIITKEIQKEILKKSDRKSSQTEVKEPEQELPSKKEEKSEPKEGKTEDKKKENSNSKANSLGKENKIKDDNGEKSPARSDSNSDSEKHRTKDEETKPETNQEMNAPVKKPKSEEQIEYIPLKIDKNRGINVLKRISNLVENINREKVKFKKSKTDVDDLSEEFYGDGISKMTRKRPRRSHHKDDEVEEAKPEEGADVAASEQSEDSSQKDAKALRKEIKLLKRLERRNRRKKLTKEDSEEIEKGPKARLRARLQAKLAKLSATENPIPATEEMPAEKVEVIENTVTAFPPAEPEQISLTKDNPEKSEAEVGKIMDEKIELPQKEVDATVKVEKVDMPKEENVEKVPDPQPASTEIPVLSSIPVVEKVEPQISEGASPVEVASTVLLVPEMDGIYYNPVVVASPVEIIERGMENPVELPLPLNGETTLPDTYFGGEIQLPEDKKDQQKSTIFESEYQPPVQEFIDNPDQSEPKTYDTIVEEMSPQLSQDDVEQKMILPVDDSFDVLKKKAEDEKFEDEEIEDAGPPDLITELIEGEKLKRWKGAEERAQAEVKESSNLGNYQTTDEPEENVEKVFSEGAEPTDKTKAIQNEMDVESTISKNVEPTDGEKFVDVEESYISQLPKSEEETETAENPEVSMEFDYAEQKMIEEELKEAKAEDYEADDTPEETVKTKRRVRRGIDRRLLTPEERIRNFKRMNHRRHALQPIYHNELPLPREGDNNFWKMAGSTVKAVFNDVIPEAYGKTKSKIENLGIAEYFKEFGKIVEQMKNLDRLFANIGQAAVKNYIRGTEDEKGDYIQVIEKKRRSRRDVEDVSTTQTPERSEALKETDEGMEKADQGTEEVNQSTEQIYEEIQTNTDVEEVNTKEKEEGNATELPKETTPAIQETTTMKTTSAPIIPTTITKSRGLKNYVRERPNDLIRDIFLMDSNPGIVEFTKRPPTTEPPKTIPLQPFEPRYNRAPKLNYLNKLIMHKAIKERRALSEHEMPTPNLQKFAPWMKTTKDFINQALTTLQRQRELSEMIARESVNDLVKREIERKVIGTRDIERRRINKREIPNDGRMFSVYEMPVQRKREIYNTPDELAVKYLTQLQPGVYIIPTEEMKNLRSEQIMKEAPSTKPGTPNMVTLNIYYDKKKPEDFDGSAEEIIEPAKINPDSASYHQQPTYQWNDIYPPHYMAPRYETPVETIYYPSVESVPAMPAEAKIEETLSHRALPYPEPFPEYVPTSHREYPIGRGPQNYYYPTETHFIQAKSGWADYKPHHLHGGNPISRGSDSGWAVQFQPPKKKLGKIKGPIRPLNRMFPSDKKRSIGGFKIDPDFKGLALPFWKFLAPKKVPEIKPEEAEKTSGQENSESVEEIFAENRRRAEAKKIDNPSEVKAKAGPEPKEKPEEEPKEISEEETEEETEEEMEEENRKRRKRDVTLVELHDIVPEWIGTVQELDNTLHQQYDELERMARIVTLPLLDYDGGDDSLYDDHFDIHRMRRSTDFKENIPPKPVTKKLDSEDSSLEVPSTKVEAKISPNATEIKVAGNGNADYALTQFFRYAYDSLVQMMKGMTDFI